MSDRGRINFQTNTDNGNTVTLPNNQQSRNSDVPKLNSEQLVPKESKLTTIGRILSCLSPTSFFSLVFALISLVYALRNLKPNHANTLNGAEQGVANQQMQSKLELQRKQYEDEMRKFELEEQKKEEEHSRRMEVQRKRRKELMEANKAESDARSLEWEKRRELEKQEASEKFEKMRLDHQRATVLKNELSHYELDKLDAQWKFEQEENDRRMMEESRKNKRKLDDINEKLASDQSRFQRQESLKRMEREAEERRFQQRMEQIRQQLAKDLENMRRRNEQKKTEMDSQLREIYRVLRNRVWNEIIESNWTRRLNTLRAANQDVASVFRSMKMNAGNGQCSEVYKNNLLAALKNESDMMQLESTEMSRMYAETGKSFLLEIKEAVDRVKVSCDLLSSKLNSRGSSADLDETFGTLCQASTAIPTLAELKKHYREHMQ